eukprot:690733-Rhodomonas_salina.1
MHEHNMPPQQTVSFLSKGALLPDPTRSTSCLCPSNFPQLLTQIPRSLPVRAIRPGAKLRVCEDHMRVCRVSRRRAGGWYDSTLSGLRGGGQHRPRFSTAATSHRGSLQYSQERNDAGRMREGRKDDKERGDKEGSVGGM